MGWFVGKLSCYQAHECKWNGSHGCKCSIHVHKVSPLIGPLQYSVQLYSKSFPEYARNMVVYWAPPVIDHVDVMVVVGLKLWRSG